MHTIISVHKHRGGRCCRRRRRCRRRCGGRLRNLFIQQYKATVHLPAILLLSS